MQITVSGPGVTKSAVTGKNFMKQVSLPFDGFTDENVEHTVAGVFGDDALVPIMTVFYEGRESILKVRAEMAKITEEEGPAQERYRYSAKNQALYRELEKNLYKKETLELPFGSFDLSIG